MRFPHFFIERPIFAAVLSILIVVVGLIAYPTLPVAQYPEIAPPTVVVSASYPGASAETLSQTVAAPLEETINGVENMIYMSSSSTGDGNTTITVTFRQGTNIDQAQVLVQNRVSTAEPRLPEEVRQIGVTVRKNSPDLLLVATLISPDGSLSQQYLSNYATLQLLDRLNRVPGVGGARLIGGRDYNMRIWIDPDRATELDLTVDEILAAVRAQNAQVAAGSVGQPPFNHGGTAFQLSLQAKGRLTTPEEFGAIIVKRLSGGRTIRLRDVARVELGAQDYSVSAFFSGRPTIAVAITQLPGSNALTTANAVRQEFEEAAKSFPPGMAYRVPYNPTEYIAASIEAVQHTLFEAIVLVALVVLLFLQSWRAAIIPIIAIPVSLVGALAMLAAFGFSLNNLSLFGLVLAIGIVVDDAIVVVENIERLMEEEGLTPREAAHRTMDEVSGALIAIALVLIGVFVPTSFIPGISGQFYKQFALTISAATAISAFVSLTLSPAMAAIVLKPKHAADAAPGWRGAPARFARGFNRGFERLSQRYGRYTARAVRALAIVGIAYACLIGLAGWRFYATPTGFIPAQDQGYLIGVLQMPPGASLQRTTEILGKAQQIALRDPATENVVAFAGFDGATFTNAPNAAAMFIMLKAKSDRPKIDAVIGRLRAELGAITAGNVLVVAPPPVRGIGTGGGFKMMLEDRAGIGLEKLNGITWGLVKEASKSPNLAGMHTKFEYGVPRAYADIDRAKADMLGVPPSRIFEALQVYLGSAYINDFNLLGRTYRVTAQADMPFRDDVSDIAQLKTRSNSGAMVPIGAVATIENRTGAYRAIRYNLYPAIDIEGEAAPGHSTGQALATMERLAEKLPAGITAEWTEIAYQQKLAGNAAMLVFGAAVLFVFLVLAAQFESLMLPLSIILIVPMTLLAAMIGINLRGLDNNVLTQIGLVVLVGLAAKNAILIVKFAKQGEEEGLSPIDAAVRAAQARLRPILMTSFAFILGVVPLVIATGPGAELRQALGTAVFSGMLGVTFFGLIFTPSFYVAARTMAGRIRRRIGRGGGEPALAPAE